MLKRMWVNQPSTLQPLHHLHGTRVLAHDNGDGVCHIYFLDGPVISQRALTVTLSDGWPDRKGVRA